MKLHCSNYAKHVFGKKNSLPPSSVFWATGKYILFTSQREKQEKKESCARQDPAVAFGIGYGKFPCELIELA